MTVYQPDKYIYHLVLRGSNVTTLISTFLGNKWYFSNRENARKYAIRCALSWKYRMTSFRSVKAIIRKTVNHAHYARLFNTAEFLATCRLVYLRKVKLKTRPSSQAAQEIRVILICQKQDSYLAALRFGQKMENSPGENTESIFGRCSQFLKGHERNYDFRNWFFCK